MGLFTNILNGGKNENSSDAANKYLNQIPGQAQKNLNPYIMPGQEAQSFVEKIMAGYKPSEGYNFKKDELNTELSNNAAAGGFAGTQFDESQRGKLIQSLLSGDMQQYLDNVMGVHNRSFDASRELNDIETGALNQQGGMAFGAAENKNARNAALRDQLLKLTGQAIGAFAGGPIGAAAMSGGGGGGYQQQPSTGWSTNYDLGNTLGGGAPRMSPNTGWMGR